MKAEYINPFLASTVSVFDTMLACKLSRRDPFVLRGAQAEHEISGVIGLSGRARGAVVLSMCREAALSATGALLGERPGEINSDVADAVGELTNIVAGSAKAKLAHLAMSVSLPTVIIGKSHVVEMPKNAVPICIPFDCPWGPVAVLVGLVEAHSPAASGETAALTPRSTR